MKIAKYAIDRPVTTLMFYLAVVLLGVISLRQLSVDLMPNISYPRLSVMTQYSGVAPEEIETLVSAPLEAAVGRIPGLRRVESVSKEGVSFLTLEFAWGSDMDFHHAPYPRGPGQRPRAAAGRRFQPHDHSHGPAEQAILVLALSGEGVFSTSRNSARNWSSRVLSKSKASPRPRSPGASNAKIQVEIDPSRLALFV